MRFFVGLVLAVSSFAQSNIDVGGGAPTPGVALAFIGAWGRNGFSRLVGDPLAKVTKFGSTGLIQQFPSVASSLTTLALVKPDATENPNVVQVLAPMYAYYSTVSVAVAGYPLADTSNCPSLHTTTVTCQWQQFGNNYVLFAYASPLQTGGLQDFATRDPYFTKWMALGGNSGLGPANSAEAQFTSQYNSQATVQTFDQGAIYNLTAGLYSGRVLAVKEPIYDLYVTNGAHTGALGAPITADLTLSNGMIQQNFEGGSIQYDPATGNVVLRPPISRISLVPSGSLRMNAGDTQAAQVTLYANDGSVLTDRVVAWNTSNGRVVQIQANGFNATLTAAGAGAATITVTAEGKASLPLVVTVTAPCCQIGEGAPTASIQQAFQNTVARNNLSVQLPAASAVARVGNGYVQQLVSAGAMPVPYLIAVADRSVTGYVVTGALLTEYLARGGPAGALGYPLSDATPGGRQTFQQGTLAGNPVQVVTGAILAKWGTMGYETGPAGSPIAPATQFLTFRGTTGNIQPFGGGTMVASRGGPLAGQTYFVAGPVLKQYLLAGGPGGDLGAPTDDDHPVNALRQQDFEGGYVSYMPGAPAAAVTLQPRQPVVTATPASVLSGTPVHLIVGGFNSGATVRVSQTGQPDFVVQVSSGAYAWDVRVPIGTPSGAVTVRASDVNTSLTAQATYTVRNASSAPLTVSIASGDRQNGAPGARLAQPLVLAVQDQSGTPVPGQTVTLTASPGAQVIPASATTGADGQASAALRLPMTEGVALVTAQTAHQVVTFSARSAAYSLTNFPALTQNAGGALLAAAASIVRYHQLRAEMPQPNGLADVAGLGQFLKTLCVPNGAAQVCDGFISLPSSPGPTVNLWRVGEFAGNNADVHIEATDLDSVRDLVAGGSPVLLALALGANGSHFVVATGIAVDGSIVIADPAAAQTRLNGYLAQGSVAGAVRLLPQPPSPSEFVVAASAPAAISSVTGPCGQTLSLPPFYFRACDGVSGPYQLDLPAQSFYASAFASGSGPVSSLVVRNGTQWALTPLSTSIAAGGVVNAASFTPDMAPGGLISIYGAGLAGGTVQINGTAAPVLIATPFQINAQIPADAAAGAATLAVSASPGSARQTITIRDVAPAIFSVGPEQAAITNLDNSLNTPANPAARGGALVIYGTGFGTVSASGKLSVANTPVSAVIGGTEIPTAFAGLTPGFIGLYQANVLLPASLPPGLSLALYLKQGNAVSNTVTVAIQ